MPQDGKEGDHGRLGARRHREGSRFPATKRFSAKEVADLEAEAKTYCSGKGCCQEGCRAKEGPAKEGAAKKPAKEGAAANGAAKKRLRPSQRKEVRHNGGKVGRKCYKVHLRAAGAAPGSGRNLWRPGADHILIALVPDDIKQAHGL